MLLQRSFRRFRADRQRLKQKRPEQDVKLLSPKSAHLLRGHEVCSQLMDERTLI
nr:MAG TPA: hypothetical protein [Caudoviricetes sp.]